MIVEDLIITDASCYGYSDGGFALDIDGGLALIHIQFQIVQEIF